MAEITLEFYTALCREARAIREAVFMEEQGFHDEFDATDSTAYHCVLWVDGEAAACGRLFTGEGSGEWHLGRVAVMKPYRAMHLGSRMVTALEEKARSLGGKKMVLSAQCRVQPFYEKLGYRTVGDVYFDEYCEHISMEKRL